MLYLNIYVLAKFLILVTHELHGILHMQVICMFDDFADE